MQPSRAQQPYPPSGYAPCPNGALAAHAVASALSNPYGQPYGAQQASHYAQAYAQYYNGAGPSHVTPDGYTISSTYVPGTQYHTPNPNQPRPSAPRPPAHHGRGGQQSQPQWYQPGTCRCTSAGCAFTGSKKSVELHMMDRHLVFPPGWEHRRKKNDWDADPSLKGKPVPIQGTGIKLDTPEAIEQWIEERKKRFPTAQNVEDKERKMRDAIQRGQLPFDDPSYRRKRRRTDDGPGDRSANTRGRGQGGQRGRGRGRGRGRATDGGWEGRKSAQGAEETAPATTATQVQLPTATPQKNTARDEDASSGHDGSDSDSDGAPEIVSSKGPPDAAVQDRNDDSMQVDEGRTEETTDLQHKAGSAPSPVKKPRPKQPRKPMYNPFGQRPSLLRNLLLPEIRMTVSNLSQAIHFLVDNDFLDNIELKPGQANERMIEVIGEQPAPAESPVAPPPPPTISEEITPPADASSSQS